MSAVVGRLLFGATAVGVLPGVVFPVALLVEVLATEVAAVFTVDAAFLPIMAKSAMMPPHSNTKTSSEMPTISPTLLRRFGCIP